MRAIFNLTGDYLVRQSKYNYVIYIQIRISGTKNYHFM